MMRDKYRLDGSPYPDGAEGLKEWAQDFSDTRGRIVRQETLWNGIFLSTVWLGLDHRFGEQGPPLIFETMAFNHVIQTTVEAVTFAGQSFRFYSYYQSLDDIQERYSTLEDAALGHRWWKQELSSARWTLKLWWHMLREMVMNPEGEPG